MAESPPFRFDRDALRIASQYVAGIVKAKPGTGAGTVIHGFDRTTYDGNWLYTFCGKELRSELHNIRRGSERTAAITCKSCLRSIGLWKPAKKTYTLRFAVKIDAAAIGDDADFKMAADYVREFGKVPEWLMEPLAESLARAMEQQ